MKETMYQRLRGRSIMTSLGKEIVDSRVLGRGRHQVVQDYHVSYSGIEEFVDVQIHRDASTKFYSSEHGLSDDVVEGSPSLVQPDDSLRRWRHLGSTATLRDQPAAERRISLKRFYKAVEPRWRHRRRESSGCTRDGEPSTTSSVWDLYQSTCFGSGRLPSSFGDDFLR
jgi:hypothetical protein